jgi:GAF domain-containing protein
MTINNPSPLPSGKRRIPIENFDLQEWRKRFTLVMLRVASLLGIALILISFPTTKTLDRFLFISLYVLLLAITVSRPPYLLRAFTLLALLYIVGMNAIISWGPWADGNVFLLAGIALSSIMLDRRMDVGVLATSIVSVIAAAILQQTGVLQMDARVPIITPAEWLIYIADFSVIGVLLVVAIGQFRDILQKAGEKMQTAYRSVEVERAQIEEQMREQTEELVARITQIRTASDTARAITGLQNITELLDTTTRLIAEKFRYYHVSLFILDEEKKFAYLQASSSTAGAQKIGQAFKLMFDKRDLFGLVVEQKRFMVITDLDQKTFVKDPNFPLTRSRMILPLSIRNEIIGMLDIHSEQPQAFNIQDAEVMQTLADLAAVSFDNVRLIGETQSLINQLEISTAIQTKRTWSKLTSRQKPAYQYTPAGVRPVFSPDKRVGPNDLFVPLVLNGQKIGAIKLKRRGISTSWSEREQQLVEKIADQVALALENSRLVDEAQKSAMRDQMIANVSTQIRETLDIEAVARTAATELRRVFDLKEAEIVVGSAQFETPFPKRNTASLKKE